MAWFCKRCDDFMLFNSDYCDDCLEIKARNREAKRRAKEKKKEEIRERINIYQEQQRLQIHEKYGTVIEFKKVFNNGFYSVFDQEEAEEIKIISIDKTIQYKITFLKEEINELYEALQELEDIKNETFK